MLLNAERLLDEFERIAAAERRKKERLLEEAFEQDDRRQRRDAREQHEHERKAEEDALLATAAEAAAFQNHLECYSTATVAALMDNETALAESRARLDAMLGQAYALPDGRRVFRSEDRQHVYDEAGAAIGRDVVDPAAIGDGHPTWEALQAGRDHQARLEQERTGLLRYQERLDAAREAVKQNPPSAHDLDALDADLKDAMPEAVRRELGGNAPGPGAVDSPDRAGVPSGRAAQRSITGP